MGHLYVLDLLVFGDRIRSSGHDSDEAVERLGPYSSYRGHVCAVWLELHSNDYRIERNGDRSGLRHLVGGRYSPGGGAGSIDFSRTRQRAQGLGHRADYRRRCVPESVAAAFGADGWPGATWQRIAAREAGADENWKRYR